MRILIRYSFDHNSTVCVMNSQVSGQCLYTIHVMNSQVSGQCSYTVGVMNSQVSGQCSYTVGVMNSQVSGQCLYTILWPIFLVYYIFVSNAFLYMVINGILFYVEFNKIGSPRFLIPFFRQVSAYSRLLYNSQCKVGVCLYHLRSIS